ncbi:putative transcription factor B3-Domain family [Helianthus annuus]|uniref:Putative regulatory protein viviparous-1 n=1 Tax=Helianthus annuus TaxID=4232 RepID=A0A251S5G9_HELAN|nr:B3 domain-containing transcription factor ABI3 isoform X2 [Helianthus annuus]KAF5763136.1 putative transcription factor B3-Domain family [Helianthus annuus]KAJ0829898.1 putative transcription factor B3-Domain family [Helianthus annuus]
MYPKEEKVDVNDLEVYGVDEQQKKSSGLDAMGTTMMTSGDDQRGMWEIDVRAPQQNLLHEMNDPSMFYNDQFPLIPDFPCMSSSSSSSSNPAPAKPISSTTTTSSASSVSSSTSSAASWAVLKSEYVTEEEGDGNGEERVEEVSGERGRSGGVPVVSAAATTETVVGGSGLQLETVGGSGTIDCMDVMENFGYMDLIDGNELWDPSSIFEQSAPDLQPESEVVQESGMKDGGGGGGGGGGGLDELGEMFFDWLKSNKESISAEDMRNIKLKRSTVESASKRLGSSKEGKKQLLKLILEWVQQHQLQRKNSGGGEGGELLTATSNPTGHYPLQQFQGLQSQASIPATVASMPATVAPPPFNCSSWVPPGEISNAFSPSWIPPYPPYVADQAGNGMAMVAPPVQPPSTFSYLGGDYTSGLNSQMNPYNNTGYTVGSADYQVLESAPPWNPSQITMAASPYNNQFHDMGNRYAPPLMPLAPCYPDQYPFNPAVYAAGGGDDQRLMGLGSSATKEARKKRMARQRRTYFHHHHHSRQNQNSHQNHVANNDHNSHPMLVDDNSGKSHGGNWVYWPSPPSPNTVPLEAPQRTSSRPVPSCDRLSKQTSCDKRQELKTEKNLKFLLQKVLKQSDVGSLGRIVLPKKEAESHLPDLDSRDGVSIAMEDIGTSQVWNMRYRFWPNNKSRMYLLENTGDFVKANGLQEGDFIVIYSDVKCGKYLIRGVKVRQPATGKSEGKKPVKRSYRSLSQSARSSPSSPAKIAAI